MFKLKGSESGVTGSSNAASLKRVKPKAQWGPEGSTGPPATRANRWC